MRTDEGIDLPVFRFYDCETSRPSDELTEAIAEYFEYTIGPGYVFEFAIAEDNFYDILSVVDAYNAPILAQLDFRSSSEVTSFLRRQGLSYLIVNNSEKTATAQRLKVPAGVYMDFYMAAHRKRNSHAEITKGLETYAQLDGKPYCRRILLPLMVAGNVRYEDVEVIGYSVLEHNREVPSLSSALSIMGMEHERDYTAADVTRVLKEKTEKLKEARLQLLIRLGAEAGFQINDPLYVSELIDLEERRYQRRVSPPFALYLDAVHTAKGSGTPAPVLFVKELYLAKVDPELVAKCLKENPECSVTRIIALHEGSANALTEGWL